MMYAELEAVLCSGPLRGKQHTYTLLDERVPPTRTLERDEALANSVSLTLNPFSPLTEAENQAVAAEAQRYGAFLGRPVVSG